MINKWVFIVGFLIVSLVLGNKSFAAQSWAWTVSSTDTTLTKADSTAQANLVRVKQNNPTSTLQSMKKVTLQTLPYWGSQADLDAFVNNGANICPDDTAINSSSPNTCYRRVGAWDYGGIGPSRYQSTNQKLVCPPVYQEVSRYGDDLRVLSGNSYFGYSWGTTPLYPYESLYVAPKNGAEFSTYYNNQFDCSAPYYVYLAYGGPPDSNPGNDPNVSYVNELTTNGYWLNGMPLLDLPASNTKDPNRPGFYRYLNGSNGWAPVTIKGVVLAASNRWYAGWWEYITGYLVVCNRPAGIYPAFNYDYNNSLLKDMTLPQRKPLAPTIVVCNRTPTYLCPNGNTSDLSKCKLTPP